MRHAVPVDAPAKAILENLIRERRALEGSGDRAGLEANRLAIVYWQRQLPKQTRRP